MQFGTREYITYIASFFTLMGVLFYWTGAWFFIFLILLLIFPLLIPMTGIPLVLFWKRTTHLIGKINGWILLSIIFFLLLSPLALLRRFFGVDVLKIKRPKGASFFEVEEKKYELKDLEKMW